MEPNEFYKKPTKRQEVTFWIFVALLFGAVCLIYGTANAAEVIQIHETLTEEQREQGRLNWIERTSKMAALNNAEIERKHALQIEVAKHQVALDLEAASASSMVFNVENSSSSYSEGSSNALSNDNTNRQQN
jgi:hypothetical protein